MTKVSPETIDLSNVLSRPVEASTQPVFTPDFDGNQVENIDAELGPEIIPPVQDAEYVNENRQQADAGYMPPEDIAETIVNLLDGLQTTIVPYLREKKVFTEKEQETIKGLDTTGGTIYAEHSPENKVLNKFKRHQEIVKLIPFDEGEKRRLVNATARYAETTQMQVSPFQGLMLAYSEVILKRSSYFFTE